MNETSSPNPSSGHSTIPVEEEEKIPSPVIDRDRLIETNQEFLSRFAGWGNAKYQAEALVDSILDALEALCRENAPDSRRLLREVDTPVMIRFMEKAVKMDFSGVNNLTSYLKCVLLDFLRKNAIVGVSQQRPAPAASYDIYEIERMINEGGFQDANYPLR